MNWFNKLSEQTWCEQQILVFIRNNAVSAKILYIVQFCWKVLSDYIYLSGDSNHGLCYSTKAANCTSLSTGNSGLCSFRTMVLFLKGFPVFLIAKDPRALKVLNSSDQPHLGPLLSHLLPIVGRDSRVSFKLRLRPPGFVRALSWVSLSWLLPPWMSLRPTLWV